MEKVRILEIKESVFADNDRQADQLRARLKEKGVFLMNLSLIHISEPTRP